MDHQDWSQWPEDQPHLDDADTADLHHPDDALVGALGDQPLDHDGLDGYPGGYHDVDPAGADPAHPDFDAGPDLLGDGGHDGFGADLPGAHTGADAHPYPDDDPFAAHDSDHGDEHLVGDHGDEHVVGEASDAGDVLADAHDPAVADAHDPAGADHDAWADHDPATDDAGQVHGEHLVGSDPDVDPHADSWFDPQFPPHLELADAPAPVDGYPWSDASVLGTGAVDAAQPAAGWAGPSAGDLYDYAGLDAPAGDDGWAALLGSDDPATSALARWWAPGG